MEKFFDLIIGDVEDSNAELTHRFYKNLDGLKEYILEYFLDWYFEMHSIDDVERYEEVQNALEKFKNTEDYNELWFDEVFTVEMQFFED